MICLKKNNDSNAKCCKRFSYYNMLIELQGARQDIRNMAGNQW